MSTFKFRLASLLKLREAARDERRAALAEAYRVDDVLRGQIDVVLGELDGLRNMCRDAAAPGVVNLDRLVESQRYELALRTRKASLQQQRNTVTAEIERRRQALIEADREVRVLEKLRQRQAEQHSREEQRRDAKRLDEVAQQQAMREFAV